MDRERLAKRELTIVMNNSDTSALLTSTRRYEAVNDGIQEFAALTECYVRRASIPVSSAVREYAVSTISDFSRISKEGLIEYHHTSSGASSVSRFTQMAGEDFPRRDELWLNRYDVGWRTSTTPVTFPREHYVRHDGGVTYVGLSELPKVGSSETVRLIVPYVARPPLLASSTDVPFTDTSGQTRADLSDYHRAFTHYAAHKLLPLVGDLQESDRQLQKFLAYVARYAQDNRPKGGQHVTLSRSYFRQSQGRSRSVDLALDRDPRWRWQ